MTMNRFVLHGDHQQEVNLSKQEKNFDMEALGEQVVRRKIYFLV